MSADVRPRFFGIAAVVMSAFIAVGFARTYYLRFLSPLPPLASYLQLHGAVFTAWLVVFVAQTRLVANHRVQLHRRLGFLSVALAALVVIVGLVTIAVTVAAKPLRPNGLTGVQFAIVPLVTIMLFAAFVALGIMYRKRADWHKRFMVLAMIAVLGPAITRFLSLFSARQYSMIFQILIPALFVAWAMLADWRSRGRVHLIYVIGGGIVVASWPLRIIASHSDWWQPIGQWIAKMGTVPVS